MDFGIKGRCALVTGASAGIGEAVALDLAREGVRLAVAARRTDRLETVVETARSLGAVEAHAFAADLSDPSSVTKLLDDVHRSLGDVDILVLNGGGPRAGRFADVALDDWDAGYKNVLRCMIQMVERVVPEMRSNRWGRIVALTSTSVKQPIENLVLSNAFRTALVAALRTLANDVAREGVTVNSIATGRILTDRLRALYPGSDTDVDAAAGKDVPIGRVASVEEFAPLIAFLCSEKAGYITGQTISIDGGLVRGTFG